MSLDKCIPGLVESGKIKKGMAAAAERSYSRHYNRLKHSMSAEAAAAEASELALREIEYKVETGRRQAVLQIGAQKRILADMDRYKGKRVDAAAAVLAADAKAPYANVEAQYRAVLGKIHARMTDVLFAHRRNLIGEARDKSGLRDLAFERFGRDTGNQSAKELAAAFGDAAEYARRRFNRAGGAIGRRDDWGLPQSHDSLKVRAVPYEQWRQAILPKLALERMIDDVTGLPFTDESIEEALLEANDAIRSDGWTRRNPGGRASEKRANRRNDHRFFVFKGPEEWLAYHDQFGTGSLYDAMMSHLDLMARDIALMEVLGPNPTATLAWLQGIVQKEANEGADPVPTTGQKILGTGSVLDLARSAEKRLGDLYDAVSGELNSPVNAVWARRFGGVRAFLTSSLLGSASLSALTDVGFQALTRAYNGLPITGAMAGYLKMLNPLNKADRRLAVRLGLIAEEASKMAASLNRYVEGMHSPEVMMRLSDFVLRVSGLSPWTQAGRWAFGMEVLGQLADMRGMSWNQIGGNFGSPFRDMLERYGIDAVAWEKIRATETYKHKGAEFLRPDDVEDEALGDALLRMVLTETDYAVPTATARSRATLSFGQRPGTLGGEIIRNAVLFKNFGVSMILTHGARMMEGSAGTRMAYAAGLAVTTTLIGGLVVQLKEISRTRDPLPMDNPEFVSRAVFQGGGFGIFGDFVGSAERNRFGGGFAETLAGPVIGFAGDVYRSAATLRRDAMDPDRDANPGREADKLLSRYTPGGSVWYARAAWERLVLDEFQRWADPDFDQSFRRLEEAAEDRGQEYWWRPGDLAPERAPQMAETPE